MNGTETDGTRRISDTSEIFGRKRGFWAQQRCINPHNWSVRAGCDGRDGRSPLIMAIVATAGRLSLNGIVPVNTCVDTRHQ